MRVLDHGSQNKINLRRNLDHHIDNVHLHLSNFPGGRDRPTDFQHPTRTKGLTTTVGGTYFSLIDKK